MAQKPNSWMPVLAILIFIFAAAVIHAFTGMNMTLLYLMMVCTGIYFHIWQD